MIGAQAIPSSTYRVQLRPEFDFARACELVDYLGELGVGALYASPVLDAVPGSSHGYDVVDPSRARPELGGEAGRQALARALRSAGLGFVLDIVPNHMSVAVPKLNRWWWDVLAHGAGSAYAHYFDIDFSRGKLLIPVLGNDSALSELAVDPATCLSGSPQSATAELTYHEHRFPIAAGTSGGSAVEVHERQHYRLVDWRRGNAELTYRRFFDVTTLAAVRVELPEVFHATHDEVLRWVVEGSVTGLRVDHPDGLADPTGYLRRLREHAPDAWLVVEKILAVGETLPASWPVNGSTGYDALREISGVFVDPAGARPLTELAEKLGVPTDFAVVEKASRKLVTDKILLAEVRRIAALVPGVDVSTVDSSTVDSAVAEAAVAELLSAFEVYRSYLPEGRRALLAAAALASDRRPDLASTVDSVCSAMLADPDGELARRVQQTSGMVVAKGTEDTTCYRYTRFVAANEVGGAPERFAVEPAEFHASAAAREAGWPATMTALSTHDTKRSEDVRARLAVLAEIPDQFASAVADWSKRAGLSEPALNLLAWQTILGAWPIASDRLGEYLIKAAREAKLRTSWTEPDADFEREIQSWPEKVLGDPDLRVDVEAFAERITTPGWSNALGQKLLQLAGPGVPDLYQGSELWTDSLVDPDNRRPVDYRTRRALLARIKAGELPSIDHTGAAKLLVVQRVLALRRDRGELFRGYCPLFADGPAADHVISFARNGLAVVATRLPVGLANSGGWRDTTLALPHGEWIDVLTGRPTDGSLARMLDTYPVALLMRGEP